MRPTPRPFRLPTRLHRLALLVSLALAGLPAAAARADEPGPQPVLDDTPRVVTSLRRRETPVGHLAGSVHVIDRDTIQARGWRTLPDALREVPGFATVQAGPTGHQTSLFVRGTDSNHVLVLVDGVEVSDPSTPGGVFDAAHLLLDEVERIEVVRGPMSTLYGSDALGGLIHVVTRRGRGRPGGSAWVEGGSNATLQHAVHLSGGGERVDYALGFSSLHTRGTTAFAEDLGGHERDGYDNRSVSGQLGFRPSDSVSLRVFGRLIDTELEYDPFTDDPNTQAVTRQLYLRGEGELALWDGRWQQRFAASFSDHDRRDQNDPDARSPLSSSLSTFDGRRLKLEWLHDLELAPGQITTLGVETERETLDARSLSLFAGFPSEGGANASARSSALFAQHQFAWADRVFGSLGARLDHHDEYGSELTYRIAAAYVHPATATRVHGSLGTAFKAPTLDDLFGRSSFARGNPDLEPERGRGFELGLEQPWRDGRVVFGVTYFHNRIRNLIVAEFDPASFLFVPRNVDRARSRGVETRVQWTVSDRLALRAHHTYTHSEDRETGQDLLRRPNHAGTLALDWRPLDALRLHASVVYVGHRKDIDALSFERASRTGYTLANLSAQYALGGRWTLFGRVENLFDREYDDPDGFQSRGFAGFVGVRARFGGAGGR